FEYGSWSAARPESAAPLGDTRRQTAACGLHLFVAVVDALAFLVGSKVQAAPLNLRQLVVQIRALPAALGAGLGGTGIGAGPLLAPGIEVLLGTLLALAGGVVALHHLRLDLDLLGIAGPRLLAEMHPSLGIGPAIDFRDGQPRQQQGDENQVTHGAPPSASVALPLRAGQP